MRKACKNCGPCGHRHTTAPASYIAANAPSWEVPNDTIDGEAAWVCNNCSRLSPRRNRRTKARIAYDTMQARRAAWALEV